MFVPTWLLIIFVVIVLLYLFSEDNSLINTYLLSSAVIFFLMSLGVSISMVWFKQYWIAVAFASPVVIIGFLLAINEEKRSHCIINQLDKDSFVLIKRMIAKNNRKVDKVGFNMDKIKKIRLELVNNLGLITKLYNFYKEIKHYPEIYKTGDRVFNDSVRLSDIIVNNIGDTYLYKLLNNNNFNVRNKVISFTFVDSENSFDIFFKESLGYDGCDLIVVVKDKKEIVFKAASASVEAFKPGEWLEVLMEKMYHVELERLQRQKKIHYQMEKEENKDIASNFK